MFTSIVAEKPPLCSCAALVTNRRGREWLCIYHQFDFSRIRIKCVSYLCFYWMTCCALLMSLKVLSQKHMIRKGLRRFLRITWIISLCFHLDPLVSWNQKANTNTLHSEGHGDPVSKPYALGSQLLARYSNAIKESHGRHRSFRVHSAQAAQVTTGPACPCALWPSLPSLGCQRVSWLHPSSVCILLDSYHGTHTHSLPQQLSFLQSCDLKLSRKGRKAVLLGAPLHSCQRSISTMDACPSDTTPLEHVLHQSQQHPPTSHMWPTTCFYE